MQKLWLAARRNEWIDRETLQLPFCEKIGHFFVVILFNSCIILTMRGISRFIAVLLAFIIIASIPGVVSAQDKEEYFPETGHFVRGAFLSFYHSTPDSLLLFGYPISEEMPGKYGQTVQYFQRARFDLDSDGTVQPAALGEMQYEPGAPVAELNTNSPACRLFPDTGYSACYSFIRFYDKYEGARYFGSPISDVEIRDGRYVQYYQKARFEWRPDARDGETVGLTPLGQIEYDQLGSLDTSAYEGFNSPLPMVQLQANAFVEQALMANDSTQSLYVIVQDQAFKPVEGAMVSVSVYFPDGSQYDVRAPSTNKNGFSELSFEVSGMPEKEVVRVEASVTYGSSSAQARTWFRIWW